MERLASILLLLALGASQVIVTGCPMGAAAFSAGADRAADAPAHGVHEAHGAEAHVSGQDRHRDHPAPHHPDRDCGLLIGCGTAVMAAAAAPRLAATDSVPDTRDVRPTRRGAATFLTAEPPPPRLMV